MSFNINQYFSSPEIEKITGHSLQGRALQAERLLFFFLGCWVPGLPPSEKPAVV